VIECKASEQVDASAIRGLRPLQAEYGAESVAKAFVVCRTERAYPLSEAGAIEAVPLAGRGGGAAHARPVEPTQANAIRVSKASRALRITNSARSAR
jgi:hypothetical protein